MQMWLTHCLERDIQDMLGGKVASASALAKPNGSPTHKENCPVTHFTACGFSPRQLPKGGFKHGTSLANFE